MSLVGQAAYDAPRLRDASPARLAALLDIALPLAERLRGCRRIASRFTLLAARRLGPLPNALTTTQDRLLRMDVEALQALALRVGAVRHARGVLRVIDGAEMRALTSAIGPDARDAALRWPTLASDGPPANDPPPLAERIGRAGRHCLHEWCDLQPSAIGVRVRLLLPGASSGGAEAALSVRIIEALVNADD